MRLRLDKFLAHKAFGTRKEVHGLIKQGMVTVNDVVAKKKDQSINTDTDVVVVNGQVVSTQMVYYVKFNKPAGYICAAYDRYDATVMDILPPEYKTLEVYPVGRLDKDTEGLLLLTNDGNWAHRIINGKKDIPKVYYVEYKGQLSDEGLKRITEGLVLGDGTQCKAAHIELLGPVISDERAVEDVVSSEIYSAKLTITEGKFHQVKRMIGAAGGEVVYLKRLSIGSFTLEGIEETGDFLLLDANEVESI
ncbi:pseudouridine synthase [uncultured Veillonella sp.]|uniref:pseudouridine synthase n=1 Tax=uncultured Veillonella sp. TaxID=159268 RepID=UPI002634E696|nr:pseudouridine synthase [uncultured Veillonella sp.]